MQKNKLLNELQEISRKGVVARMGELEQQKGFTLIPLESVYPIRFTSFEWYDGVISIDENNKEIRVVMVGAKLRQRGAFRRLISNIKDAGYSPVVVAVIGPDMSAIMKHWDWRYTIAKYSGEGELVDEWRPRS